MENDKHVVTFSDIHLCSECIRASICINPLNTIWRPDVERDKIQIVSHVEGTASIMRPTISDIKDNKFNIKLNADLSYEIEYKLVYIDKENVERGVSLPFVMECNSADSSITSRSSGSFEVVSGNEQSFTAVNFEDTSIDQNWEIPTYSGTDGFQEDELENLQQSSPPDVERETNILEKKESSSGSSQSKHLTFSTSENNEHLSVTETTNNESNDVEQIESNIVRSSSWSTIDDDNPWLNNEEKMTKSVILGDEQLSHAEVRSLQTKNRTYLKKFKKVSELLDNEKKVSKELLKEVMQKTEDNLLLVESIEKVRIDLHNTKQGLRDAQKKIKKDCNEKDALIISLKKSNESLQKELGELKKGEEQILPLTTRSDRLGDSHQGTSEQTYRHTTKTTGYVDRKCDVEITRLDKTSHHHQSESKERDRQKRRYRQYIPRRQANPLQKPPPTKGSNEHLLCPVCDRQMPSSLSEREMTRHVESCLQKREA